MVTGPPLRQMFRGKRILITGGLGFIGSNLARWLAATEAEITLVDSLVAEYGGNLFNLSGLEDRVRINISDVRDEHSLAFLVRGQDYLFNLAGQTSHLDSMEDPYTDLEINCRAQLSILEACRKFNPTMRVVFASTRQMYGRPDYLPVDEEHLLRPVDVNGINKMAGEWYHILYHRVHGLPTCALRLTNTYGPRMRVKDARQTFLGVWIRCLATGQPFEVWEGAQRRDFNYVDDVVDALLMAILDDKAIGRVFNLGGEEVVTLLDLAQMMAAANGGGSFTHVPFPAERKRIDIGDYFADFSLIEKELGWRPRVPLQEGLARTVDFYHKHLAHYL
ncbi:MAG: NAD-dependent epimerase/dehydratase family protein [Verrucomicrobia bacterium]|nr:NAD-dependent epimerase/dehydratase family protein [Verrucomicrobiota bacterium]